jgi:glycosyltransferase involved in cell wall biosynthesis
MNTKPRVAIFMAEWILLSTSGNTALTLAENGYDVDFFLYKVDTKYFNFNNIAGINVYDFSECVNDAPLLPDSLIRAALDILQQNSYYCFIGIERMGLIWAGMINDHLHVPLIYLNLELYTTTQKNYTGDRFHLSKKAEREYHQTTVATIIQDPARAKVLLEDNEITDTELLFVPVSVFGNQLKNKGNYLQRRFNFLEGKRIILYFGELWESRYVVELAKAALNLPENWVVVIHCGGSTLPESLDSIIKADQNWKVIPSTDCLPQNQICDLISSADIGVAFYSDKYLNPYLAGSASEKIALYFQSSLPVITFAYPSFKEIIEKYRCGLCINTFHQLNTAIETILSNYDEYKSNAAKCFTDHYEFRSQFNKVLKFLEKLK